MASLNAMLITTKLATKTIAISVHSPRINFDASVFEALTKDELKLLLLLQEMRSETTGEITPDQRQIATILGTTQSTVSRRMRILRILRLIGLIKRENKLREKQSYVVYDRPADIDTILSVDSHYLVYLIDGSETGSNRVRQLCEEEIQLLKKSYKDGTLSYDVILQLPESLIRENFTLCTNESPLCTNESPLCTNESPLCTNESPLCTNESPLCTNESPLCTPCITENLDEKAHFHRYAPMNNGEILGYIYNRACAPAHRGIKNINIFNNNHTSIQGWGCGGRDDFFDAKEVTVLFDDVKKKFGNHTSHAIKNRIKLNNHQFKDHEFSYRVTQPDVEVILTSLICSNVRSPIRYVDKLIHAASQGELTFHHDHYKRYCEITGKQSIHPVQKKSKMDEAINAIELIDGMTLIGKKTGKVYKIEAGGIMPGEADPLDGFYNTVFFIPPEHIKPLIASGHLTIRKDK